MQELGGKVAVVTGGASGIGFATASALAGEGMKLVLADIEADALDEAVAKLAASGAEVIGVATDVASWESVEALRDAAVAAFGTVHLVMNNAGVGVGGSMWDLDLDTWRWTLGVNLWGVIHGVKAFVPLLLAQGEGHVVNTASVAGLTSPPFMGPYNVTKHGVVTLSETLATELAMAGGTVGASVLCPGWVRTRIHESDRNRPGEPSSDPDQLAVQAATREAINGLISGGISPDEVAARVVDAIKTDRFYILTHPEMTPAVGERVRRIVEGEGPSVSMELFESA
jgi:NAD(P)-dependent dehydrogenase (short-subunit alcohol dehydrogenase family)